MIIIVVVVLLVVVLPIVMAAVLYVMVSGLVGGPGPGPGPQTMGVDIRQAGMNWSVTVQTAPSGLIPPTTYLSIKDQNGLIVLARTAWSALTLGSWGTNRVAYQDANPSVAEIRPGDTLVIDRATYPTGHLIEISNDFGLLTTRTLQ